MNSYICTYSVLYLHIYLLISILYKSVPLNKSSKGMEYIIVNNVQTTLKLATINPMIDDFSQSVIARKSRLLRNYTKACPGPNAANQLEQIQQRIRIVSIRMSSINAILGLSLGPKTLLSPYTYIASPAIVSKQP